MCCGTACTTGCSQTRTWRRCWRERNIIISLCLHGMRSTSSIAWSDKLCWKRWNICGTGIERMGSTEPVYCGVSRNMEATNIDDATYDTRRLWDLSDGRDLMVILRDE